MNPFSIALIVSGALVIIYHVIGCFSVGRSWQMEVPSVPQVVVAWGALTLVIGAAICAL